MTEKQAPIDTREITQEHIPCDEFILPLCRYNHWCKTNSVDPCKAEMKVKYDAFSPEAKASWDKYMERKRNPPKVPLFKKKWWHLPRCPNCNKWVQQIRRFFPREKNTLVYVCRTCHAMMTTKRDPSK